MNHRIKAPDGFSFIPKACPDVYFLFSSDAESVDRENFPEERMYPDYSQQRLQQVKTHLH